MYIDGICFFTIAKELNNLLAGSRIDKVFQPSKHSIILHLRTQQQTNAYLAISASPQAPYLAVVDNLPYNPSEPTAFCMLLRKHLIDGRLDSVVTHSLDRVIILNINTRSISNTIDTKQIIIELTGKNSNIIFVNNGLILECLRRISKSQSRYRQIFPNISYQAPPIENQYNLLSDSISDIITKTRESNGSILRTISKICIGIGSISSREICHCAHIPEDIIAADMLDEQVTALTQALQSKISELTNEENRFTLVEDSNGKLLSLTPFHPTHMDFSDEKYTFHSFTRANQAIVFSMIPRDHKQAIVKERLLSIAVEELKKREKKIDLLQADLAAAHTAFKYKTYGDILMANLHLVKQGMQSVTLHNFYSDEDNNCIEIPLSPIHKPSDNAQRHYNRYNKAKRAITYINGELANLQAERDYLENTIYYIETADSINEVNDIETELKKNILNVANHVNTQKGRKGNDKKRPAKKTATEKHKIEILQKTTPGGLLISIGRNNKQNDFVTFKKSLPNDLWLHAKDIPGSHVILHTAGKPYSDEDLIFAAQHAAYHSKYKHSSNVPIDYTERKNVTKPNGSKPGFVIYEKQKTLFVEPSV